MSAPASSPAPGGPWWADGEAPVPVRKRRWLSIVGAVVAFSMVGFLVFTAARNPGREVVTTATGATINAPSLADLSAGCTGIIDRPATDPKTVGWIPDGKTAIYDTLPPVAGAYSKTSYTGPAYLPPSLGETLTLPQAVGLMYRGYTIVWFKDTVLKQYRDQAAESLILFSDDRVVMAEWPKAESQDWGSRNPWVFTSWNTAQLCADFDYRVLREFVDYTQERSLAPGADVPLDRAGPKAEGPKLRPGGRAR